MRAIRKTNWRGKEEANKKIKSPTPELYLTISFKTHVNKHFLWFWSQPGEKERNWGQVPKTGLGTYS